MKWFLLLALVSVSACSHKEKSASEAPETTAAAASAATESESKPVSPLTVKPCFCMKIFQPVCAGGQSYGNSCEAECNGHKTWTEGDCASVKAPAKKTTKKK